MRSLTGIFALAGGTVGSFAPALWGGSMLGVASLLCATAGGVAGIWAGVRLANLL